MSTGSTTTTFTITSARHLSSKVAADLRTLHRFYGGNPSLAHIDDLAEEVTFLLRDGYLERVDYGFRRPDGRGGLEWALRLRYQVSASGSLTDSHPGGVPTNAPINGADFYSYLYRNVAFYTLTTSQQKVVLDSLPISRTSSPETSLAPGAYAVGRGYHRDGVSLDRSAYVASR